MNFTELVNDVASRLNLTSTDALTRIGIRLNDRYKRVTSSIGLITSRRVTVDQVVDPTAIASTLPDLTIPNMEKVLRITIIDTGNTVRVLDQLTYDDITNVPTLTRTPHAFAVKTIGPSSTVITLDGFPTLTSFTLHIEGYDVSDVLSGVLVPNFPEDFHDLLVEGVMSDELRKMEKPQLAQIAEGNYQSRLSDLRMFIAKSAYLDLYQGKDKPNQSWYRPWNFRINLN